MRFVWLVALLGCSGTGSTSSSTSGSGTVVYSTGLTAHIATVDVATGTTRLIDPGLFGAVAIAADGQHVAYAGMDTVVKVADLDGNATVLDPPSGSCGVLTGWGPASTFSYCVYDATHCDATAFVSAPGASPRVLLTDTFATSNDGSTLVYNERHESCTGNRLGDIVVERADGTGRRVLRSDAVSPTTFSFTPDQQHVLAVGAGTLELFDLGGGATRNLGSADITDIPDRRIRVAQFSPDGREVLVATGDGVLAAIDLTTMSRRTIATLASASSVRIAVFGRADRVVYTRAFEPVPGNGVPAYEVHVVDSTGDRVLVPNRTSCGLAGVSRDAELIGVVCEHTALLVRFDGEIVASADASGVLGMSADSGLVLVSYEGELSFMDTDGEVRVLGAAVDAQNVYHVDAFSPYAAYAP